MELLNTHPKTVRIFADQLLSASHIVLLIPWLLFLGMGLSTARLVYQAWQEQALLDTLETQLRREKLLQRQKRSFSRLSSHYLRTPLTLISNGIELMNLTSPDKTLAASLARSAGQLKLGVDALLTTDDKRPKPPQYPSLKSANYYLLGSLAGAMVVVSAAVYLLANLDFSNLRASSVIGEGAVLLMTAVLIFSASRGRGARRIVRKQVEKLLSEQKELDKQRNELARGSLANLNRPLEEIKTRLRGQSGNNPSIRATVEGVREFEDVLRQFTILASLETGTMQTVRQEVSLKQTVTSVIERLRPHIERKKLQVRLDLKADRLNQDPLLLEFVLNSVIENAVEFSPAGKNIDIISRQTKDNIDLFIRDQGAGIDKEKLAALFQPFFKTETGERFEHQGLGLSLYLDKLVVNYLGGEIAAESRPGEGTIIKIRLPAGQKNDKKPKQE
jgi:signal transduction histidine kinase